MWEWNEALISGSFWGLRGSSWLSSASFLQSSFRNNSNPTGESVIVGFRVATVPEPSTLALAAFGAIGLLIAARRKSHNK